MAILELHDIRISLEEYFKQIDLTKLTDDELNKLCMYKVSKLDINKNKRLQFLRFIMNVPFSRKHALVAIKKLNKNLFIPYIHRHILKAAYDNDVPKGVIKLYISSKKSYDKTIRSKGIDDDYISTLKFELEKNFNLLYECTLEMIKRNNSRKEKIYKIILRKKDGE